jgi:hypothetical protein
MDEGATVAEKRTESRQRSRIGVVIPYFQREAGLLFTKVSVRPYTVD